MRLNKIATVVVSLSFSAHCFSQQMSPTVKCIDAGFPPNSSKSVKVTRTGQSRDFALAVSRAAEAGFEGGTLYLDTEIGKDGDPVEVVLTNPTKYKKLNESAISLVKSMAFEPGVCTKSKFPLELRVR